jgi:uncharacterized YccA/Bax inhibitor family protein
MSSFSGRSDFRQRQDRDTAYRTGNPILSERRFAANMTNAHSQSIAMGERMTIEGTTNKTGVLLLCALVPALFVWSRFFTDQPIGGFIALGAIGGFITALITTFKAEWSPVTAPIYAALEGLFIGGLSAMMEFRLPGIALQAGGLTFGVLFTMLALYKARIIRVTDTFRTIIFAAMGGIVLVYVVSMLMRLFTGYPIPLIHEGGLFGVIFSLIVVGVAAFSLAMDFDFIETAANEGAPKYMEWYGAFGLMVTLVWLYIEILRLLSKLRSNE